MRQTTYALLLSALSAACAEPPTGTAEATSAAFNDSRSVRTTGAVVVRAPFQPGVLSGDPTYAVAVGFEEPYAEHCADSESPDQPGGTQLVFTPSGGVHVKGSGRAVNVIVFAFSGVLPGHVCDLVGAPVVATGTGNLNLNVTGEGPGADHFSVIIHGIVDLVSGGQARLLATTSGLTSPQGEFVFDHTRVTLTPR